MFECQVTEIQYHQLLHDLKSNMKETEDSVRVYRLRDFSPNTIVHMGRDEPIDFTDPLLL